MVERAGVARTDATTGLRGNRRQAPTARSVLRATKAETLEALRRAAPDLDIPELAHFPVTAWRSDRERVLRRVLATFRTGHLAVRSSTHGEDEPGSHRAGHFRTCLDVPCEPRALAAAIDEVIASYEGHPEDRVLVQEMARGAVSGGVLATRDPAGGGPYLVFEYQGGRRTDLVTAGAVNPRRVVLHRCVDPSSIADERLRGVARLAARIERLSGREGVEIEIAQRATGRPVVLQVRALSRDPDGDARHDARIARALRELASDLEERLRPSPLVAGTSTVLGQMPDWNPAELIGAFPSPLGASLFAHAIGDDVWQRARSALGYQPVPRTPLVAILAGRPWVDVRASFNSLLPAGLDRDTRTLLVDAWLDRLRDRPELHDRVELEIAQTARDFAFESTFSARFGRVLSIRAVEGWGRALGALTTRLVRLGRGDSLTAALAVVSELGAGPLPPSGKGAAADLPLARARHLLVEGRERAALPFAIVARHAFVAEALLRSAVGRGALSRERLGDFRRGIATVAGEIARDFAAVRAGQLSRRLFLSRWGHLRPGTFDVASPRFDARPDLFDEPSSVDDPAPSRPFRASPGERAALDRLAREADLAVDGAGLLAWAATAIAGRERAKFVLSRHVSAAIEEIAAWGHANGLDRDDLAQLSLRDILAAGERPDPRTIGTLRRYIAERRAAAALHRRLRLGVLLRDPSDVHAVPDEPSSPTFVTTRRVVAMPLALGSTSAPRGPLRDRIVCIESADPGFDWIFGRGIAGLVTLFGGGNSHMAIRCHEIGLPAAIGVGDLAFERLVRAPRVELHCGDQAIRCFLPDPSS